MITIWEYEEHVLLGEFGSRCVECEYAEFGVVVLLHRERGYVVEVLPQPDRVA